MAKIEKAQNEILIIKKSSEKIKEDWLQKRKEEIDLAIAKIKKTSTLIHDLEKVKRIEIQDVISEIESEIEFREMFSENKVASN